MSELIKVWVITTEKPSLGFGGSVRNFYIIKALIDSGKKVTLFTALPRSESNMSIKKVKYVYSPVSVKKTGLVYQMYVSLIQRVIPYMENFRRTQIDETICMSLKVSQPDCIVIEHLNAYYGIPKAIKLASTLNIPIILDEHNVESVTFETSLSGFSIGKRLIGTWIAPNLRKIESHAIQNVNHVFTCSEIDANYFPISKYKTPITVIPNGADIVRLNPANQKEEGILFVGALDYTPNDIAIRYFCTEVLPKIKSSALITIVGRCPPRWLLELAKVNNRIKVTGFVGDVRPYLESAAVCICPLKNGSGTRLKLLEYMAMAKAVVSTTAGAEGLEILPGKDMIIANTPESFADSVTNLLQDETHRHLLGNHARRTVIKKYDWENTTTKAVAIIESLASNKL